MIHEDPGGGETTLAIRNALRLGVSLLFTWGIALAMRFWLPRHLGPDRFGTLSFADAFSATFFVALSLGVDSYVRKEISVRPAHASDFFGGAFVLRVGLSGVIVAVMMASMHAMHRSAEVCRVVALFALAQFFVTCNATLSALLHAKGRVAGMSMLAIATKLVWAVGVLAAIAAGVGLWGLAVAYLVSEAVESVALFGLANRHVGLVFRVDLAATRAMVLVSAPYYLNTFATTAYGKLDVTLLAVLGSSREVGFYAAASAIASLALLITPLIGWVLMPTLARAASRSRRELFARVRRSMELILSVAIPASLFVDLGSDVGVRALFGDAFAPAGPALRILAPTFVVTYVAIVFAMTLVMLERAWTLTAISIAGLVVNLVLNLALIPPSMARLGDGGGGVGCALSMLGTEVFVTAAMMSFVGREAIDRRTVVTASKSLAACIVVVGVDRFCSRIGCMRLALDAVVYVVVVVATGALRPGEIARALKAARADR